MSGLTSLLAGMSVPRMEQPSQDDIFSRMDQFYGGVGGLSTAPIDTLEGMWPAVRAQDPLAGAQADRVVQGYHAGRGFMDAIPPGLNYMAAPFGLGAVGGGSAIYELLKALPSSVSGPALNTFADMTGSFGEAFRPSPEGSGSQSTSPASLMSILSAMGGFARGAWGQ